MHYNTEPHGYAIHIAGQFRPVDYPNVSPSTRIVQVLQKADPRIRTKGFRASVLEAIFVDGVSAFVSQDNENYAKRVCERMQRRFGKQHARRVLLERCDILNTWRYRDARFIPDAYLIDAANRTVVCYEVEDTHPLNPRSLEEYFAAWWNLEFIFWDLHLISYDIYGHYRIHHLGMASLVADEIEKHKRPAA